MSTIASTKSLFSSSFAPASKMITLGRMEPFLAECAASGKRKQWPAHMAISFNDDAILRTPFTAFQTIKPFEIADATEYKPEDLLVIFDRVFKGKDAKELRQNLQKWIAIFQGTDRGQIISNQPEIAVTISKWVQYFCCVFNQPYCDNDEKQKGITSLLTSLEKSFYVERSHEKCIEIQSYLSFHCNAFSSLQELKVFDIYGINTSQLFRQIVLLQEVDQRKFLLSAATTITASLQAAGRALCSEWGLRDEKGQPFAYVPPTGNVYEEPLRCTNSIAYQIKLVSDYLYDKVSKRVCESAFDEILQNKIPDAKERGVERKKLMKDFFDQEGLPLRAFAIFLMENLGFLSRVPKEEYSQTKEFQHLHFPPVLDKAMLPSKQDRKPMALPKHPPIVFQPEQANVYMAALMRKLMRSFDHQPRFFELMFKTGILAPLATPFMEKVNTTITRIEQILQVIEDPAVASRKELLLNIHQEIAADEIVQKDYDVWALIRLLNTSDADMPQAVAMYVNYFEESKAATVNRFKSIRDGLQAFFDAYPKDAADVEEELEGLPLQGERSLAAEQDDLAIRARDLLFALDVELIPDSVAVQLKEEIDETLSQQRVIQTKIAEEAANVPEEPEAKRQRT